ncbi:MAG: hypothetical protein PHS14_15040, partial [Elusimicrobia bacterium]|nr:hypothetical protein [Elusimicrobiota bacterium]
MVGPLDHGAVLLVDRLYLRGDGAVAGVLALLFGQLGLFVGISLDFSHALGEDREEIVFISHLYCRLNSLVGWSRQLFSASALTSQNQQPDENPAGLDDADLSVTIGKGHQFMRTVKKNFKRRTLALALSIAVMPILVNGQAQSLSTVNKDKSSNKSAPKSSDKDAESGIAHLIASVLKAGSDENTGSNLA